MVKDLRKKKPRRIRRGRRGDLRPSEIALNVICILMSICCRPPPPPPPPPPEAEPDADRKDVGNSPRFPPL